jgi:hypothetical protein
LRASRKGQPGGLAALDEGIELATRLPAWVAVLWLTALPARFLLVAFLVELGEPGPSPGAHFGTLLVLAFSSLGLWLPSLYGRQLFIRACRRALEGDTSPGWEGFRIPPGELAGAIGAALLVEAAFWGLLFTVLVPLLMVTGAALAAVAAPRAGPRLGAAMREMALGSGRVLGLALLLVLCLLGFLIALVNLHLLFLFAVWLVSSVAPFDAVEWEPMLGFSNPLYVALLVVGAALLVEPFWLASVTVHVERLRARKSGEDLRQAFADIRRQDTRAA